jgi:large repetitive protein
VFAAGAAFAVTMVPMASEFQVNAHTAAGHSFVQIDAANDGTFIVVWASDGRDGSGYGVFARLFDSNGEPRGAELQVNSYTPGDQIEPRPAILDGGAFIVAWVSEGQDGSSFGVFGQRFDQGGTPLAAEFQVNAHTLDYQLTPALDVNDGGEMVVAWSSAGQDGSLNGVFARRYDPDGALRGGEFQVNTYTLSRQGWPDVAVDEEGGFIVSWSGSGSDTPGIPPGLFARRFDAAGSPSSADFQVNTYEMSVDEGAPRIAGGRHGEFALVWSDFAGDGSASDVIARVFAADGTPRTDELQVNLWTVSLQEQPALAMEADGDFVVVWASYGQDESGLGIFARTFDSMGRPASNEFEVNTDGVGHQTGPVVAIDGDGDVVVAWRIFHLDGSPSSIRAQRYAGPFLDVDEDGVVQSLTDGILVFRYLFGFTNEVLTRGAVELAHCARCTAPVIEAHLGAIVEHLDVDGDGQALPLTDGVLVLRWLFGFEGTILASGAVDLADCTRCDAPAIEEYLESLD